MLLGMNCPDLCFRARASADSLCFQLAQRTEVFRFKKELKKHKIAPEEYVPFGENLRIFDLAEGKGDVVGKGDLIVVLYA